MPKRARTTRILRSQGIDDYVEIKYLCVGEILM